MSHSDGDPTTSLQHIAHTERRTIDVPGLSIDLVDREEALDIVRARAQSDHLPPLAVASINLDHIHHFGAAGRWARTLGTDPASRGEAVASLDWLNLIDGAPIAAEAHRLSGRPWPRLAGSDLADPILAIAEHVGLTVGFLGGSPETHALLSEKLAVARPDLQISGYWAPSREELADADRSAALADDIAGHATDILVVGLGKPRQELWMAEHGVRTGARVLLGFGAVVDFLAGRIQRAPAWVAKTGMEWAWRLLLEPRRLARRYLVQGPPAYSEVRSWSRRTAPPRPRLALPPILLPEASPRPSRIVGLREHAAVAVVVVTYNSARDIGALLDDLAREAHDLPLHVIVVDNGSTDHTVDIVRRVPGITLRAGHGNLGYAAAINIAVRSLPRPEPVLVLNPDVSLAPGAIRALLGRMATTGAGIVVPRVQEADGSVYESLHYEPTVLRCAAEAAFGSRLRGRPTLVSETDRDPESYLYAHPIDWATGAAMLIHPGVLAAVGRWDEQFFLYSEETDYFRRARDAGATAWYEPGAVITHRQGGSGSSAELDALMAVNRARYARKHMSRPRAVAYYAFVVLHEAVRSYSPEHRLALRGLLGRRTRAALPHAVVRAVPPVELTQAHRWSEPGPARRSAS